MSTFTEMEAARLAAIRAAAQQENMKCHKCGSDWLELREYKKFRSDSTVTPGDPPVPLNQTPVFYVLECPCGEVFEVQTMRVNVRGIEKIYDEFLDQFEKSHKMKETK